MTLFGIKSDSRIKAAEVVVKKVAGGGLQDDKTRLFCDRFLAAVRSGKSKTKAYEEALRKADIDDFLASAADPRYVRREEEEVVAPPSPSGERRRENPRLSADPKKKKTSVVERPIPGLHLDRATVRAVLRQFPNDSNWPYEQLEDDEEED